MVGIAGMIGGSIFVLTGPAIGLTGSSVIIAFMINATITIFTAIGYAELGSAMPEAGGGYLWVREGLPRPNAFLSGWMAWFAQFSGRESLCCRIRFLPCKFIDNYKYH